MASSSPNSTAVVTKKIIVGGIPTNISSDKLIIYFQKKRNVGGGDVQSITFPITSTKEELDSAIITFEEAETAQSVLRHSHEIGGKSITTSAVQSEIFENVSAKLSKQVIQKLTRNGAVLADEFVKIMDCTGSTIVAKGQSYKVKGEWYQVQATFAKIESILCEGKNVAAARGNGRFSRPSMQQSTMTASVAPSRAKEVVSITLDKDMFKYMQMNNSTDIDKLKNRHGVDFKLIDVEDAYKIVMTSSTSNADTQKAKEELKILYDLVSKSVHQDVVPITANLPSDTAEVIFASLRPEFPQVYMTKYDDSQVIFIAPDDKKFKMAVDMFNHFLGRAQPITLKPAQNKMSTDGTPQSTVTAPVAQSRAKEVVSITLDKDIFEYMQMNHSTDIDNIKNRHGVDFKLIDVVDAYKIVMTSNTGNTDKQKAKEALKKLYDSVSKSVHQEVVPISADLPSDTAEAIFASIGPEFPQVHMTKYGDSQVIFTAPDDKKSRMAVDMFNHFLGRAQPNTSKPAPKSPSADETRTISVDNDVFQYLKLTRGANLNRIWDQNGVKITQQVIGDCLNIRISASKNSQRPFNLETAIDEFQKLYNFINDKSIQKTYDTSKVKFQMKLSDLIRMVSQAFTDVYVTQMVDSNSDLILFIASDEQKCDKAYQLVDAFLNPSSK